MMKKRFRKAGILATTSLVLLLALAGCGKADNNNSNETGVRKKALQKLN